LVRPSLGLSRRAHGRYELGTRRVGRRGGADSFPAVGVAVDLDAPAPAISLLKTLNAVVRPLARWTISFGRLLGDLVGGHDAVHCTSSLAPLDDRAAQRPAIRGGSYALTLRVGCDDGYMAAVSSRPPRPVGRPGYDLDSLLAVAVAVFNQRGYDGTSMEHLAARLRISKSSIYHHVPGKAELLRLAINRALDGLFAATEQADTLNGLAIDRLENLVRRSIHVLVAELPYVTLLLRIRGNSVVERRALARRREFDHIVGELVQAACDEGSIRPDADPELTSRLIFGTVNSITEWYRPARNLGADELADAVVAMVFHGLRAAPNNLA
jgi:AcrR family transcriptional regulator